MLIGEAQDKGDPCQGIVFVIFCLFVEALWIPLPAEFVTSLLRFFFASLAPGLLLRLLRQAIFGTYHMLLILSGTDPPFWETVPLYIP